LGFGFWVLRFGSFGTKPGSGSLEAPGFRSF
jgi:hypothetical protein